ncbi:MAG TPA: hypothetical protein VJV39_01745 [Dongiaceae bacterium]|nr:hypothetical protein [Dongiaceae bacterium]
MPDDRAKAPNSTSILTAAIISGALIIAVLGTFLPDLIGIEGTPALAFRLVFYGVAVADVAVAFWLRSRINKARQARGRSGNTVQPMR